MCRRNRASHRFLTDCSCPSTHETPPISKSSEAEVLESVLIPRSRPLLRWLLALGCNSFHNASRILGDHLNCGGVLKVSATRTAVIRRTAFPTSPSKMSRVDGDCWS